jgi:hypothetical protein
MPAWCAGGIPGWPRPSTGRRPRSPERRRATTTGFRHACLLGAAQQSLFGWPEGKIDDWITALATQIADHADDLAAATVAEIGIGCVADKADKNRFASLDVARSLVGKPGVGIIGGPEPLTEIAATAGLLHEVLRRHGAPAELGQEVPWRPTRATTTARMRHPGAGVARPCSPPPSATAWPGPGPWGKEKPAATQL